MTNATSAAERPVPFDERLARVRRMAENEAHNTPADIAALKALISAWENNAVAAVPCWRPIDTAPRDGTRIIVTRYPATGDPPMHITWWASVLENGQRTRAWRYCNRKPLRWVPTHWTLLPPPPEGSVK